MRPLGDEYVRVLQMAFDEHWIDAYPAANKRKETFTLSAPGHPYVLLNFTGSVYDSVGLAHELGHAVHMYLSENSSDGNGSNSVLAAEIASGVSELLFAEYMASHAPPKEQLLFAMYLMDLYASRTFTQMMLSEFENMVHSIVDQGGTLTAAGLSAIWLELDEKYRGESALPEGAQYGWASVAHFYQDFYVCNYTLSFVVADRIASTLSDDSQKERYLYFLSTTSKKPIETAKSIFEIDLEELAPYERLYASFSKRLQTQEQLLLANGLLRKADGGITVNVQGRRIDFAHPAYVEDGATMVDAKEMATAIGVELQINPDGIILLHSPSSALIPYVLNDGREYVHIRKLLQSSGYNVDYIPHSNTVMITR